MATTTTYDEWIDDMIERFRCACERNPSLRYNDDFEGWLEANGIAEPVFDEVEATASESTVVWGMVA